MIDAGDEFRDVRAVLRLLRDGAEHLPLTVLERRRDVMASASAIIDGDRRGVVPPEYFARMLSLLVRAAVTDAELRAVLLSELYEEE